MMNFGNMMKQAQQMQKRLQDLNAELAATDVVNETQGVKAVVDGNGLFKSISISKELINPESPESVDDDTVETLEDVISSVINNAVDKALKQREEKTVKITNGIRIPGLF